MEHDPREIWSTQLSVARQAMNQINASAADIAAIGITNQRETAIVWDKNTGKPVYNAIVWQCRRTSEYCDSLKDKGLTEMFQKKTGTGKTGRITVRYSGDLADLEADKGSGACYRLFQCIPDDVV